MDATPPQADSEFDEFASDYEQTLDQGLRITGENKDYFANHRVAWLVSQLSPIRDTIRFILDFGCGTGTSSRYLNSAIQPSHYLGFDPSSASIDVARLTYPKERVTFTSDATDIPISQVDLAFTNGVFHHIPIDQRAKAASIVWNSLKPGAHFAFWENNCWNPMVHFLMSRVPFDQDAHMLFPHQARRLLIDAGFEIVLTDYLFVFPAAFKWLRHLEPSLCKLPLGGQYLVLARKPIPSPLTSAA
jgi:SAM-dependent methyltransferase